MRQLKLIGVEGIDPSLLSNTRWARLPTMLRGREAPREVQRGARPSGPARRTRPRCSPDHRPPGALGPVDRSSRPATSPSSASIASGAEVVAGGSIHVYGALRGRAIAGVRAGESARIFCRRAGGRIGRGRRRSTGPPTTGRRRRRRSAAWAARRRSAATTAVLRLDGDRMTRLTRRRKACGRHMAKVLVVTSGKGGVGKTTTSAVARRGAGAGRPEGRADRLRRRPAQPRPDPGRRAAGGVRPRQRDPWRRAALRRR